MGSIHFIGKKTELLYGFTLPILCVQLVQYLYNYLFVIDENF